MTPAAATDDHATLLLDCLRANPPATVSERLASRTEGQWQPLLRLARQHGVAALLHERLTAQHLLPLVPDTVRVTLADVRRRLGVRNLLLLHEAGRAASALQSRGIPVIALKGVHLASDVYPHWSLRRMADIDLLVRTDDLQAAANTLQAEGYAPVAPIATYLTTPPRDVRHLPRFNKAGHAGIEVHWHIEDAGSHCGLDGLWERSLPMQVGGAQTLGLSIEDLLFHVCVHASHQHKFAAGIQPFCDVAEIIRRFETRLDWSALVERARRWRRSGSVYLSLRLAREMVGATVPDDVFEEMRPEAFDDRLAVMARAIAVTDAPTHRATPWTLINVANARNVASVLRQCLRRVRPPDWYVVQSSSLRVLIYCLIRFLDLLTRFGSATVSACFGGPALPAVARQRGAVRDWLARDADVVSAETGRRRETV